MQCETLVPVQGNELPLYQNAQSWRGPDMAARDDWVHEFTAAEIEEIDAAVEFAAGTGRAIVDIGASDFPLRRMVGVLETARSETLHGRGFCLFRGLPVHRYSMREAAIAYWGIGCHIGLPVSQNGKGHVLGHVANLGLDYADPEVRGYQTMARLPYHSDLADIVALLCLRPSRSGGLSSIVSSTTVWNELVRTRIDHARTLLAPFHYTRWGEIPAGKLPYEAVPVFAPMGGHMVTNYVRSGIVKAQKLQGVPLLTQAQVDAMDYLDKLAADPALHLDMEFRPGDIQMLSNHYILHSRTAYEDWPEQERRRHLLRLWLACDAGPELPGFMYERTGVVANGRPDGVRVPGVALNAPLDIV